MHHVCINSGAQKLRMYKCMGWVCMGVCMLVKEICVCVHACECVHECRYVASCPAVNMATCSSGLCLNRMS